MPAPRLNALVIDVGNTSTSFALVRGDHVARPNRVPTGSSGAREMERAIRAVIENRAVDCVVAASVVPDRVPVWARAVKRAVGLPMHWVTHRSALGIPITYPRPETIGADRLANAAGAAARYGVPVVVADFGTALTFDIVGRTEGYCGGIIAPGLPLMFQYLADQTALLPRIEPGSVRRRVGKSTEEAMRIGAQLGYRGMVREIFIELREEIGPTGLTLVATGGHAGWVVRRIRDFDIVLDPHLTLRGLARIGELNAKGAVS